MLHNPPEHHPPARPRAARWVRSVVVGLGSFGLGGCVSHLPTESGFLSNYATLTPDRFHLNRGIGLQRAETFEVAAADIVLIDSYYIEPVEWRVDPQSRGGRSQARRDWLCRELDVALRQQLGATKPIVDRPGPRTARVRSAITMVELSRPVTNTILTATLISPYGIGPIFGGGGAVEAEVLAPDGRQIAAISSASTGGWFDLIGYYTRSDHARKAMARCAEELVEAVAPSAADLARRDPESR